MLPPSPQHAATDGRRDCLVGVTMVKNEADIIEDHVRHHLRLLDRLYILVQASDDGTEEILADLQAEDPRLTVEKDPDPLFRQAEKMTWLAKRALAAPDCAGVFPLDADEFLKGSSREALLRGVAAIPADLFGILYWQSYVPHQLHLDPAASVMRQIVYRCVSETKIATKVVLTPRFLEPEFSLVMGSHLARRGSDLDRTYVPLPPWEIAHFPIRSAQQTLRKIAQGVAQLNAEALPHTFGRHWRLIDALLQKDEISLRLLQRIAGDYQFATDWSKPTPVRVVGDPLPCDHELKYAHHRRLV